MTRDLILILITVIILYGMYLFYNIKYIVPLKNKELDNKKENSLKEEINTLRNSINYDKEFELRYKDIVGNLEVRRKELRTETNVEKIIKDVTEFSSAVLTNYVMPIYDNKPENFSEFQGLEGGLMYPLTISAATRENDLINIMKQIDTKMSSTQKADIEDLWMPYNVAKAYIRDQIVTPNYDMLVGNIITKLNNEATVSRIEVQEANKTDLNSILKSKIDDEYLDKFATRK